MLIQTSVSRPELSLKLTRMAAELESKGTVEDPVSSQFGWCQDSIVSLQHRMEDFQFPTLAEMRKAAGSRARRRNLAAAGLGLAGFASGVVAAASFASPGATFPIALAASTGLAIASFANLHLANQDSLTDRQLGQWEAAFQRGSAQPSQPC